MNRTFLSLCLLLLSFMLVMSSGCAEDLSTSSNDASTQADVSTVDDAVSLGGPNITVTENGDGTWTATVDSSDGEVWVYMNLENGTEVTPDSPDNDATWDLSFQRFKIRSNGGISGVGDVVVAKMTEVDFDALTVAPSVEYLADAEDSDDSDSDPDYVFLGESPWYDYDLANHTLSPADVVYVVRGVSGDYFKVQMVGYYDAAGTGGFPSLKWGKIDPPDGTVPSLPSDDMVIDASVHGEWVYVDILSNKVVTNLPEPTKSKKWDLAFSRTKIQTNSGTSAEGSGGALEAVESDWESITTSPTVGFAMDSMLPAAGPPGAGEFSGNKVLSNWYNYDGQTHVVTSKEANYLVRAADGEGYAKLKILTYASGVLTVRMEPVQRVVEVHNEVIDASDSEAYVYYQFDHGTVVTPTAPEDDHSWDLAISRTQMRTNSGTSGSGSGGALATEAKALADVLSGPTGEGCYLAAEGHICDCEMTQQECTEKPGAWTPLCECPSGFMPDEMLPIPGPPGSGESSGNPVLANWYDYDMETHVTSPKDAAFILKTASGDFVKLQVIEYQDGVMTLDWAYAGPGQTTF